MMILSKHFNNNNNKKPSYSGKVEELKPNTVSNVGFQVFPSKGKFAQFYAKKDL